MRRIFLSIYIGIGCSAFLSAQAPMDSLKSWGNIFLDINQTESVKNDANQKFTAALKEELENPASLENTFSILKNISVLSSPDKNFRIFTWFTLHSDGYHTHGLVQAYGKKLKTPVVTVLHDDSEDLRSAQYKTLSASHWYGALYFNMVPFKIKGKKYYLLFGFDGNDGITHKKIVDVIQVSANGTAKFGANVFVKDKKSACRLILEYNAQAKVSVKYDDAGKRIVFDHLAPQRPELVDQYQYYVPDLSYDAFVYTKNGWEYRADVDAKNAGENAGSQGTRLVVDGVNDDKTLDSKSNNNTAKPQNK